MIDDCYQLFPSSSSLPNKYDCCLIDWVDRPSGIVLRSPLSQGRELLPIDRPTPIEIPVKIISNNQSTVYINEETDPSVICIYPSILFLSPFDYWMKIRIYYLDFLYIQDTYTLSLNVDDLLQREKASERERIKVFEMKSNTRKICLVYVYVWMIGKPFYGSLNIRC